MSQFKAEWLEHQRRRYMRPNSKPYLRSDPKLYLRHDAHRFLPPQSYEPKYSPDPPRARAQHSAKLCPADLRSSGISIMSRMNYSLAQIESGMLRLKWLAAATRLEIAFWNHYWALKAGYRPDQPRVPAGNPDGGQWTSDGGGTNTRLASADKPRLGRETMAAIALQLAKRLIDAYRSQNSLWDLFGRKDGTVTVTTINGTDIFGSNSNSLTYTAADDRAVQNLRATLLEKYPNVFNNDNIGQMPNNALYHAETTVLLRAARANGGTLAGQTLEVFSDNPVCRNCDMVLPYVGLELGNPTVTFVGPNGARNTIRNGAWLD